jgi:hypothetical protein
VGKTTVATEVSTILDHHQTPHVLIDMDALRQCFPAPLNDPFNDTLGLTNLAAVWPIFRAAGAERVVMVDIVESRHDVGKYDSAIPGARLTVVRLAASLTTLRDRVTRREVGSSREWFLQRTVELADLMERERVGDVVVPTDNRPLSDIAREVLCQSGWVELPPTGIGRS